MTKTDSFLFHLLCAIVAGAIFAFDLTQQLGVAGAVPYVLLVLLGLLADRQRTVMALAAIATILTLLGMHLSQPAAPAHVVALNRTLALLAIWSVAGALALMLTHRRRLETLLNRDALTGLYNRKYLLETLAREISLWKRGQKPLSLIMLDIDRFKSINDRYGHQVGDRVLSEIAEICSGIVRGSDLVCRFGGEEFAIVLPDASQDNGVEIAERIRNAIENFRFSCGQDSVAITVSQGVAQVSDRLANANALLAAADTALYQSKNGGRNRVSVSAEPAFNRPGPRCDKLPYRAPLKS